MAKQLLQPSLSSGERVICRLIGDEGVLFSQATGCLYRLNTTAAFIWCCYEEGLAPLAIAGAVAERFNIPRNLARRDVIRAFSEWISLGLLATSQTPVIESPYDISEQYSDVSTQRFPYSSPAQYEHHYQLLGARLRVRYPCQNTETLLHPIFAHLEACLDEGHKDFDGVLDIIEQEAGYVLLRNGIQVGNPMDSLELASAIQRQALIIAYEASNCLVAIHAAAVCNDKKGVLLPGATGSGKSTLTAALVGSGFTYLTDELTLLMPETYRIRPAPVSLCLKRGSWPLLNATYEFLDTLPVHYQEGKEVRYLPPPRNQPCRQATSSIACIVFPKYAMGKPTALRRLGGAEALYRVAEAGYAIPGSLDKGRVEHLINWIAPLDCYELQIDNLDQATYLIKELLT